MQYKKIVSVFLGIAVLVMACASKPATEDNLAPVEDSSSANQESLDQATLDVLNTASVRADNFRKYAFDFGSPSYFPKDWENADAQYQSAVKTKPRTTAQAQETIRLYNTAAEAFESLFHKSLPLYAQDREDEIMHTRTGAIELGIRDIFPDYLLKADQAAIDALKQYESAAKPDDYYTAATSASLVFDRYKTLKDGAEAYKARQEIKEYGFTDYAPRDFQKADETGIVAVQEYEAGNIKQAQKDAEATLSGYRRVLKAGWQEFAAHKAAEASAERQAAIALKAHIAIRDDFNAANEVYEQAEAAYNAEKFDEAAHFYVQSKAMFIVVCNTTIEKRKAAEQAIIAAEEKMIESDEKARNAELILEGGVQ